MPDRVAVLESLIAALRQAVFDVRTGMVIRHAVLREPTLYGGVTILGMAVGRCVAEAA